MGQPQEKIEKKGSRLKEERKEGRKEEKNERTNERTNDLSCLDIRGAAPLS